MVAGCSYIFKDILRRTARNLNDVRWFGPLFLIRHLPRLTGAESAVIRVPGIGKLRVRAGESDAAVLRQIFGKREYQIGDNPGARLRTRYQSILDSGGKPVIVDAGANIGAASVWFHSVYPDAAIVAIEPESGNLSLLRRNLAGVAGVTVIEAGVGGFPGFVKVTNNGLGWAVQTQRAQAGIPVLTMAEAFSTSTERDSLPGESRYRRLRERSVLRQYWLAGPGLCADGRASRLAVAWIKNQQDTAACDGHARF